VQSQKGVPGGQADEASRQKSKNKEEQRPPKLLFASTIMSCLKKMGVGVPVFVETVGRFFSLLLLFVLKKLELYFSTSHPLSRIPCIGPHLNQAPP